jgi:hypothetical protein
MHVPCCAQAVLVLQLSSTVGAALRSALLHCQMQLAVICSTAWLATCSMRAAGCTNHFNASASCTVTCIPQHVVQLLLLGLTGTHDSMYSAKNKRELLLITSRLRTSGPPGAASCSRPLPATSSTSAAGSTRVAGSVTTAPFTRTLPCLTRSMQLRLLATPAEARAWEQCAIAGTEAEKQIVCNCKDVC